MFNLFKPRVEVEITRGKRGGYWFSIANEPNPKIICAAPGYSSLEALEQSVKRFFRVEKFTPKNF